MWPTNLFALPRNSIEDRGFLGLARGKSTQWNLLVQDRLDEAVFYGPKIPGRGKSQAEKICTQDKKNAFIKSHQHMHFKKSRSSHVCHLAKSDQESNRIGWLLNFYLKKIDTWIMSTILFVIHNQPWRESTPTRNQPSSQAPRHINGISSIGGGSWEIWFRRSLGSFRDHPFRGRFSWKKSVTQCTHESLLVSIFFCALFVSVFLESKI